MSNIESFLNDARIEAVKLQLQVSAPAKNQKNDVIRNIFNEDLCSNELMETIKREIKVIENTKTVLEIRKLYDNWNLNRLQLQADGYGCGERGRKRAAEAYAYVFLIRILKRHFNVKVW